MVVSENPGVSSPLALLAHERSVPKTDMVEQVVSPSDCSRCHEVAPGCWAPVRALLPGNLLVLLVGFAGHTVNKENMVKN